MLNDTRKNTTTTHDTALVIMKMLNITNIKYLIELGHILYTTDMINSPYVLCANSSL